MYGPALNRRIVTPARYLFVQAVDAHGRNFTESAGSGAFHAKIFLEQEGGQRLLLKSQLHDRGDGSYQIFFFYGIQPTKLIFHVTDKRGSFVGGKGPRVVKKPEVEQCDCPDPDPERWAGHYGCREREPQIARDFARFPRISRAAVRETVARLRRSEGNCFVHYAVRGNRLYGRAYGMWQGFKQYTDELLLSLMRRVAVPDVEFVFNLGDWPLGNSSLQGRHGGGEGAGALAGGDGSMPIISFCGSNATSDIVVPTYKLVLATVFGKDIENVREVDARAHGVAGGWARKRSKMVWRGRDSNALRVKLVDEIGPGRADLMDVNISKNQMNYYPSEAERRRDARLHAGKKVERRVGFVDFWRCTHARTRTHARAHTHTHTHTPSLSQR